jgi:hypothetical protein
MILSDRENKLALRREHMGITPAPADRAFSSTSIDLTLHEKISFWTPQGGEPAACRSSTSYQAHGAGRRKKPTSG